MADKHDIGKVGKPIPIRIEAGKIREFARSIKDPNPLYYDENLANAEIGGIMPPPTFLMTLAHWDDGEGRPQVQMDLKRVLHGEQEFEYLKPIYAGDVLTAVTKVADVYEKSGGRGGKMTFVVMDTEFTNQKGEKVAISRSVTIETGQVVAR
ncbi:MAG TPA: MaoC family dehydratase N-terminal domain-containing protein [Methylomirabilota bacterium]|jgi:acyl dehydratase|nr:MaoC family dehydratase N-terminal domain-containing protein [Methylomirabilota bacterium]